MCLRAICHLLLILNTPLLPVMQSIVDEGTIQLAVLLAQRDTSHVSAYWDFLELVTQVAPYHSDVLFAAHVPRIIFSKMVRQGPNVPKFHNLKKQKMSMRALSALVHERNGPGTAIDFFDKGHGMACVFNFVHMQPRLPKVDAIGINLLMELTVRYPETVVRMCSLGLIHAVNEIMRRDFAAHSAGVFLDAVTLFEALASDATNLRSLSMAEPYGTLRLVMQRTMVTHTMEIHIKAMNIIAALAKLHGPVQRAGAPADVVTLVLDAMHSNSRIHVQLAGVCALANLVHHWRNVDTIVAQEGVFCILRAVNEHPGQRGLVLTGLDAIGSITSRIRKNSALTLKVQLEGRCLIEWLFHIISDDDDISVLRQVLKVFSDFVVPSPKMRALCNGLGSITEMIRFRQLDTRDKKRAQRIVQLLRKK